MGLEHCAGRYRKSDVFLEKDAERSLGLSRSPQPCRANGSEI
jgi:hypothetical protein